MIQEEIILGHIVSKRGIEVDRAKVELIFKLSLSTSVKQIQSFLGHVGFYRRFIKDFSKTSHPLCNLLTKDVSFKFDKECLRFYGFLRKAVTKAPIIQPLDWSLPFEIICDASDFAIGAVLGQRINKYPVVIYYTSRTLNEA